MKKSSLIVLVLLLVTLSASIGEAKKTRAVDSDKYKNMITAARETIWTALTDGRGSCATVAVMDQGRIVYSECMGVAERSKNRPVDKNTRFNIGSTSKMFVAVAILLLVDEGLVGLDEPIAKYIPEFTMKDPRYKDITVRMIFDHSSGLPGSTFFFGYETDAGMHARLFDAMKDASLKHKPGAMSMYCNDGFTLGEIIVERVSGKKYVDFLAERIFKPLGMKNTGASVGEAGTGNIAEYYDVKTGKKYPPEVVMVYGAGGLASTAEDLCRFGDSFNPKGHRILSDRSLAEIRRVEPLPVYKNFRHRPLMSYFGWEYSNLDEYEAKGIQVLGKGGNTQCYSTNLQIAPDMGISIGVIVSSHASGESLTRPILDALMKDKNIPMPKTPVKKPVEAQAVPDGLLKFAGVYVKDNDPFRIAFNKEKNGIEIYPLKEIEPVKKNDKQKNNGPKEPAKPELTLAYNDGVFHNYEKALKYYFIEIDGCQYMVQHKYKYYGHDMTEYQKIGGNGNAVSFKTDISGEMWLIRNETPYALAGNFGVGKALFYEELPGYVNFGGIKKIETPDFAGIAATAFRDQSELRLIEMDGETWLKSSFHLFSPASRARKLIPGINRVVIKSENYNEWLKVEKGAIVRFEKPEKGRVVVLTGEDNLYDSIADKDEVYAPEGGFIFFAGKAGDIFRIEAR